MDEEVVLLEEQIASLQADVDRLQTRLADAEALAIGRDADLSHLRSQMSEREALHAAELEALQAAVGAAEERGRGAAQRYRTLLLEHDRELPGELITGETVEEVDAAVERARLTVSQVRQRLEAQAQASRVPAGAPARLAPDLSSLTPAEKIRHGLQQS